METSTGIDAKQRLSAKLLKAVLMAACVLGISVSCVQIFFDARQFSKGIDSEAWQMLAMIREPSTQAAYKMEPTTGEEILFGLMEHQSVHIAAIKIPNEPELAVIKRDLSKSGYRYFSDYLFEPVRIYRIPLYKKEPVLEHYGELFLAIDTAHHGQEFIQRSLIVMVSGIFRAIAMAFLLYLIYSLILTKPLNRLIRNLYQINPDAPGPHKLSMPNSRQNNELSIWVRTANQLLESIERNLNLRQKAEAQIMRLSQYDYLTRLPNRRTLQKHLQNLINKPGSSDGNIAILCLGLDDFKSLNAHFNFNAAEHELIKIADRLRNHIGNRGFIGKLGEDQFAIILSKITQPYAAAEMAQALLKQLATPITVNDEKITINGTVGITLFPDDGQQVDNLLQQAEFAMIMAKSRSQNRYQFYIASVDTEIRQRKKLERDLHEALKHHELSLVYQPQIDFKTSRMVGAEALLRWKHPEKGLISPEMFIPMAEDNLEIIPIGDWVLESACQQLHEWHKTEFHDLRIAVNLSAIQLRDKNIVDRIKYLLEKYQIPPRLLEIEVTETSIMEDIELSSEQLNNIKATGITLAMDDFGTGYSSLSYLKQFPFDKLKIDKSFVEGLPGNKENTVIVEAIIQLGRSFGIKVIAEGIENREQETHLIKSGCTEGQGYFYSKPLADQEFAEFLRNWKNKSTSSRKRTFPNEPDVDNH
ncbi:putative bifunctional diguanylate cyclase/phosphodiesterase [Endozoicomonas sp. 8E]|uniref:putative bifunctional diguanylate cyclase/phosphodiesterase n=1 Tax=Endozoicomonas sp. 8E TaxID=3035692 RepID=UPI0029391547|nr:EAL domain-containing protein [Endozoicomonas sp. 8E]WOG29339.1 EAL domain-containing protein [Endozoicomonas sp. 8E]